MCNLLIGFYLPLFKISIRNVLFTEINIFSEVFDKREGDALVY